MWIYKVNTIYCFLNNSHNKTLSRAITTSTKQVVTFQDGKSMGKHNQVHSTSIPINTTGIWCNTFIWSDNNFKLDNPDNPTATNHNRATSTDNSTFKMGVVYFSTIIFRGGCAIILIQSWTNMVIWKDYSYLT